MSIAVCLATYRDDNFSSWFSKWEKIFQKHGISLYISWDSDVTPTQVDTTVPLIYTLREDFPDYIPKGSSACRSISVKKAYDDGHEFIMFLDDDVFPPTDGADPIQAYKDGFKRTVKGSGYYDVSGNFYEQGWYSRGCPYGERHITPIVAQYGGWDNTPDFDARDTALFEEQVGCSIPDYKFKFQRKFEVVPKYLGFTGCFMNCIFRRELAPTLYHLYQGIERAGHDRFDDIWASLILKRICDEQGWSVAINGYATCEHARMSNTEKSLMQEQAGHKHNERLWEDLQRHTFLTENTVIDMYEALACYLPDPHRRKAWEWLDTFK